MGYQDLENFASQLENDYVDEAEESWDGSAFAWIRSFPPPTKGAIGRRLAQSIFSAAGVVTERVSNVLLCGNHRIVVRFSMEWTAGGFKFEQFKDTNYDFIFCLGVRPSTAYAWLIPKNEILVDGEWQERPNFSGQHLGIAGSDTSWLSVNPESPPAWLTQFGGSIAMIETVIANQFGPI